MSQQLIVAVIVTVFFATGLCSLDGGIRIDPVSRKFIDTSQRVRVFHGVNAVYKIAPWHPTLTGFDMNNTLSSDDAKLLRSWGFNIVRLGVLWPGVEPNNGEYDQTYLDACETIVDNLAAEGIYVILDVHQDLFHRKYCGEGVPDWVLQKCQKIYNGKPFPAPVVKEPYPIDENNNPAIDSCLSKFFASYYMTAEVSSAFQCLYDNHDSLWNSFANMWKVIAMRFKDKPSVLGYELLNEPWMGDIYSHPKLSLPGNTEKEYLQPMYQFINTAIRQVDDSKIVFFEGLTIDYWPSGFTASPGPTSYNDRQALAYHIYCVPDPNKVEAMLCSGVNDEFFAMRHKDSERLGVATIMTEFGAIQAHSGALHDLDSLTRQAAKHGAQSWMYWQYKYFQDLTTCTPSGESLFDSDGKSSSEKLGILSRPYPSATAGNLISFDFDDKRANLFVLKYFLLENLASTSSSTGLDKATTVVRFNADMHYPRGLSISITGSGATSVIFQCIDRSSINLVQTSFPPLDSSLEVEVSISADCEGDKCSCAF